MFADVSSPRCSRLLGVLRFVHDRNPFYLLSALYMFLGFRIILGALNSAPGDWKTLLELIVTLNVYEVIIIGLALFLIIKRGLRRDGWILLGVEALFLVDLTNLNAELFTAMPALGSLLNALCFALAMTKILIIVRMLGLRLSPGTTFYIAAQLAFLLGLPGIFRMMQSPAAAVSPMQIYVLWWMAGVLIAAGAFLVKRHGDSDRSPMAALPWWLYVVLPLVSLLVHLSSENRVYWVHFHCANIAPVLLGVAVARVRSRPRWHHASLQWALGMAAFSILLSIVPAQFQHELTTRTYGLTLSPLRLILLGSCLMTLWLSFRHHSALACTFSMSCLSLAGMGTDVMEIDARMLSLVRSAWHLARRSIPESPAQWGIVSIATAFVLLGVGAWVSLRAPRWMHESEPAV